MSVRQGESSLPQTTRRALLTAVLLGVLGLSVHQPAVLPAMLTGVFVGWGIVGLAGSPGRVTVAGLLLPLGLVSVVAIVGVFVVGSTVPTVSGDVAVEASVFGATAVLVAAILGASVVATVTESVSMAALRNASQGAFAGAVVGVTLAALIYWVSGDGEAGEGLEAVVFLAGDGLGGFTLSVFGAAVALLVATVAAPDAAVTTPTRREQLPARRKQAGLVVVLTAGGLVGLATIAHAAGATWLVSSVLDTIAVRAALTVITALGVGLAGISLAVRWSWRGADGKHNPDAAILLGTVLGLTGIVGSGVILGVSAGLLFLVPILLGLAGVGLWGLHWSLKQFDRPVGSDALPLVLAVLCLAGAIAVGADIGDTTTVGWSELGVVLTLGAGLFAYSVGRYGKTLGAEVSGPGVDRTPQLAHVAYAGTVVGVSAVLAVAGFWVAMALAPTFSVSATIGLLSALLATVLVVRFFLR